MRKEKANNNTYAGQPPKNISEFIKTFFKGFFYEATRRIHIHLIIGGITAFIIFILHAFFVVYVNDGFLVSSDGYVQHIIAIDYPSPTVYIFWFLTACFISMNIMRISKQGLKGFFLEVVETPFWLKKCIKISKGDSALIILYFAFLTIIATALINNYFLLIMLALIILFSFNSQLRSGIILVLYLIRLKYIRIFKKDKKVVINMGKMHLSLFGIFVGLIISAVLPFKPLSGVIAGVIVVSLAIAVTFKKLGKRPAVFIFLAVLTGVLFFYFKEVPADDGGWVEGGSNLLDWLKSPGAYLAMLAGLLPSALSGIGSLFASMGSSILQNMIPLTPPGIVGPGVLDIAAYIKDCAMSNDPNRTAAMGIYGLLLPGLDNVMNPMVESVLNFGQGGSESPGGDFGGSSGGSGGSGSGESGSYPDYDIDDDELRRD